MVTVPKPLLFFYVLSPGAILFLSDMGSLALNAGKQTHKTNTQTNPQQLLCWCSRAMVLSCPG